MENLFKKQNRFLLVASLAFAAFVLMFSPRKAKADDQLTGTITYNGNGTCTLNCVNTTGINVMAIVSANDNALYERYTVGTKSTTLVVPLTMGNTRYRIRLMYLYNPEKNAYLPFAEEYFDVNLSDENVPFSCPNTIVDYKLSNSIIKESMDLVKGCKSETEVVEKIHQFVLEKYSYDYDTANGIKNGTITSYKPDVENAYKKRKGICYDYAAVFAAMLRIQGIEVKLVTGYPTEGFEKNAYHAWNQIYDSATKSWYTVDITWDSSYYHNNRSFTLKKNAASYSNIVSIY